ncbi:hypothetical protein OF846_002304 [Rhodotorula toruloides]|nr:hypothetical protein OF846_002304 [Rhodotorula toruloides]
MSSPIEAFCPPADHEHIVAVTGVSRGQPLDQISGEFYRVGRTLGAIRGGRCSDDGKLSFFTFETQEEARRAIEHIHNADLGIRLATDSKCLKASYGFTASFWFAGSPPCKKAGNFVNFPAAEHPAPASAPFSSPAAVDPLPDELAEDDPLQRSPTPLADSTQPELATDRRAPKRRRVDEDGPGVEQDNSREQSTFAATHNQSGETEQTVGETGMIQDSAEQVDSEETKNEEGAIRETSGFDQQEVEDGGEAGAEKVDPRDTGNAGRAVQDGVDAIVTAGGLSGDGYSARYNVDYAQHRIRVDIYGERGLPLAIKEADAILVQGIAASCFDFDNPNKLGVDLCTIARVFHISVDKIVGLVIWPGRMVEGQPRWCIKVYFSPTIAGDIISDAMSGVKGRIGRNGKRLPVNSLFIKWFDADREEQRKICQDRRDADRLLNRIASSSRDGGRDYRREDDRNGRDDRWARNAGISGGDSYGGRRDGSRDRRDDRRSGGWQDRRSWRRR